MERERENEEIPRQKNVTYTNELQLHEFTHRIGFRHSHDHRENVFRRVT